MNSKMTVSSIGMIWFGAAISIAEIFTGTLIAPLGFKNGLCAIIIGHIIGCILLYFAGLIGAKTGKNAMETVRISFGKTGGKLFSLLNVLQLVGWTAVMIAGGAVSADLILNLGGIWVWCIVIGLLVTIWLLCGFKTFKNINIIAMSLLFVLSVVLSFVIFKNKSLSTMTVNLNFWAAVELSVAMPLSWLPLISDYTSISQNPKKATAISTVLYFFTSCWMYIIGLGASIFTGESDIAKILLNSGLGITAMAIVIFSTVTTTFLDVYSSGISFKTIFKKTNEKQMNVIFCVIGTLIAIFTPITKYENFLYLISSVFVPMAAILIVDFFILKNDSSEKNINILNICIWILGFVLYQILSNSNISMSYSIIVMVTTGLLTFIFNIAT